MQPWAYWGENEYWCMATTIAYGHAGFFPAVEIPQACRYYFMMGALQRRYVQVPVAKIEYWDGKQFLSTSEALPQDANKHGQVRVTYTNGLVIAVNVDDEPWEATAGSATMKLTKYGWLATGPHGFLTYSTDVDGRRVNYAHGKEYTFAEAGGKWYDFGEIATDGEVCLKTDPAGGARLIAIDKMTKVTLKTGAQTVVTTDEFGKALGEVTVTREGERVSLGAVKGAVNYELR